MKNRKVEAYSRLDKTTVIGTLLGFGVDFEELNNGVGQYTTAIIECPDGSVITRPVEDIKFIN